MMVDAGSAGEDKAVPKTPDSKELIARSRKQKRLIEAAIAGNRDALGELYRHYRDFIVYYCRHFSYKGVSAEGAEAEVALRMVLRIQTLKDPEKFVGWLYSMVRYTCMELNRAELTLRELIEEVDLEEFADERSEVSPDRVVEDQELTHLLLRSITHLPRRQRQVAQAFYLEELSYAEIQRRHGLSAGSVAKTLNQARENLRQILSRQDYPSLKSLKAGIGAPVWMAAEVKADLLLENLALAKGTASLVPAGALVANGALALFAALGICVLALQLDIPATAGEPQEPLAVGASPGDEVLPAADDLLIVFEGNASSADALTGESKIEPDRYDPQWALFMHEKWEPVGYYILNAEGSEVLSQPEDPRQAIELSALGLAPGEYTLYWKARGGEYLTATLSRSFVVGS
jgi:RNA polymerase sigma factor (sigma-70 family)